MTCGRFCNSQKPVPHVPSYFAGSLRYSSMCRTLQVTMTNFEHSIFVVQLLSTMDPRLFLYCLVSHESTHVPMCICYAAMPDR